MTSGILSNELSMIVTYNPVSIRPDTSLHVLLEQVYQSGIHHWPVVNDQSEVIGMVSDSDVIRTAMSLIELDSGHLNIAAEKFMSPHLVTIDLNMQPLDALQLLVQKQVNSLPVVREGKLQAMVTSSDFVREYYLATQDNCEHLVKNCFELTPVTVSTDSTLEETRTKCIAEESQYAVVSEGECPLGVISKRDINAYLCEGIAKAIFETGDITQQTAVSFLKENRTVFPSDSLSEAARLMYEYQLQGLTVINHQQELLGIITQEDILKTMLNDEDNCDILEF